MKLPLAAFLVGAFATAAPMFASAQDIPGIAVANGSFQTLVAALSAVNLVEALSEGNGPFTVFAPTDDAFADLPEGLVDCLLEPENQDVLTEILLYHVAEGAVLSTQLSDGMAVPTLLGEDVDVNINRNGVVRINSSIVSIPDIRASNGVIHVIDSVLVPPYINVPTFLNTCAGAAISPPANSGASCHYMGQAREAGQWLTGPTHTCRCSTGGQWVDCYSNGATNTRGASSCHYMGKTREAGQWLTGPTHTCRCSRGGQWVDCYNN